MTRYGMLLTTLPSKNAAMKMARLLIDERLAACVQLSSIESFYRWQGETKQAAETLLLIKTAKTQFEAAIARIKQKHPYEVPEIVAMDFTAGFAGYFGWIDESLKPPQKTAKKSPPPKAKSHPRNDGGISARKNTGLRTGISQPMRVK